MQSHSSSFPEVSSRQMMICDWNFESLLNVEAGSLCLGVLGGAGRKSSQQVNLKSTVMIPTTNRSDLQPRKDASLSTCVCLTRALPSCDLPKLEAHYQRRPTSPNRVASDPERRASKPHLAST